MEKKIEESAAAGVQGAVPEGLALVPKWAGQFDSHAQWVNKAQSWLASPDYRRAICVDAKGRRCAIGADMARARDEGAFPVRFFWECEVAAPVPALAAKSEQPQDGFVAPPTRGTGSQREDASSAITDTASARRYVDKWHRKHFPTDRTFQRYIMADPTRSNALAGDFAWQLAKALEQAEAGRFREQGGITNEKSSQPAPTRPSVGSVGDDPKFQSLIECFGASSSHAHASGGNRHEQLQQAKDGLALIAHIDSLIAAASTRAVGVLTNEQMRDAVAEGLSGMYGCGRVWSAWSVGTMGEDDFYPAEESDECIEQVVDAISSALAAQVSGQNGEGA